MLYSNEIKEFIKNHLLDKKGKISSTYLRNLEKNNPSKFKEIKSLVPFAITNKFTEIIYCILNDIFELPKCYCGNNINSWSSKGYSKNCSIECHLKSKSKKEKTKLTCLKKYGVENPSQDKKVIDQIKKSKLDKYGSSGYNNRNKSLKSLSVKKFNEHLDFLDKDIEPYFEPSEYFDKDKRIYKCKTCGNIFGLEYWQDQTNQIRCTICKPKYKSKGEGDLTNFLTLLNIKFKKEDRTIIKPKEIDFYLPDFNLAIEYNGLLWHSYGDSGHSYLNNLHKENINYHLDKTKKCNENNIQLLHIFENEWLNPIKQEIWKSIISNKIKMNQTIFARKCKIKELTSSESKEFLDNNHLQGNCSASIRLGLFYNDELVSLLTLAKPRYNKNYDWEIIRFANKKFINVVGSFSKLLKYFRQNYSGSIITYADKRYSNGDLYRTNGFEELKDSKPNYFYVDIMNMMLISRVKCQKHKLKDFLKEFNPELTEAENMFNNGYRRIWDCGNKVFILN